MSVKRILILIASLAVLYVVGILFIYILIDYIVFSPVKHSSKTVYSFSSPYKEFRLNQPNNERINMLYFKTDLEAKSNILFLHGANKSADYWATHFAPFFLERDYNVLIPDYRGYGKSDGDPSEFNWYEDAQLSYSWLKSKVGQDSVIVIGYGLGAVAAAYLSNLSPCRMVILINPIYGIRAWIRQKLPALVLLPRDLKYDFNLYEYLPNILSPVIILNNTNSNDITPELAKKLSTLLQDQSNYIALDYPNNELPLQDSKFIEFFDLLLKE